jgi:hypothetical protein
LNRDSKSIIKHLLTADVTKRYGNMKNGVKDIIDHRWFRGFDWKGLLFMTLEAPFIPKVKYAFLYLKLFFLFLFFLLIIIIKIRNAIDTTNFSQYPDSDNEAIAIRPEKDPFLDMDKI